MPAASVVGSSAAKAALHHYPCASVISYPISSSSSMFSCSGSTNQTSDFGEESVLLHVQNIYLVLVPWWPLTSDLDSYEDGNCGSGCQASGDSDLSDLEIHTSLGVPEFPAATSEEGEYYQNVLLAVERWFSLFGWPGGFFPISVPHSLRRYRPHYSSLGTQWLLTRCAV